MSPGIGEEMQVKKEDPDVLFLVGEDLRPGDLKCLRPLEYGSIVML